MGEYIEFISQIKPKNNQNFPIADTRDLIGGYIQLDTMQELNEHPTSKLRVGMLAYVIETNLIYQFKSGTWSIWSVGEGSGGDGNSGASIIKVDTLDELDDPQYKLLGQIVFIDEIKDLRYYDGEFWKSFTRIYIQSTEPDDKGGIWIDTSDERKFTSEGVMANMVQVISILQEKIRRLEWVLGNQLDFGDFNNNHYKEYDDWPTPEEPKLGTDPEDDLEELLENLERDPEEVEPLQYKTMLPSGKHLSIKGGTYADMIKNKDNFLPNELLWCEDRKQLWIKDNRTKNLIQIGSVGGGETPEPDDKVMEQILTQIVGTGSNAESKIVGIEFGDMNSLENTYRLSVKDGKLDLHDYRLDVKDLAGNAQTISRGDYYSRPYFPIQSDHTGNVNSPMIYINSFYCGANGNEKSYKPCSHNFVELSNLTNKDLNLKGLYLHYTNNDSGQWVTLPLSGVIKQKRTFLIRGAQSAFEDINTTVIKVPTFDIEWTKDKTYHPEVLDDSETTIWNDKELIKFSSNSSFYITGEESVDYFKNNTLVDSAPWSADGVRKWYIDLVGVGTYNGKSMPCEKNTIPKVGTDNLYVRYHTMDYISQAIKATTARANATDWTYIDLTFENEKLDKTMYIPKASFEYKDVFYNKTRLKEGPPNMITSTFGQNAHTTRGFSWVSVGYYDEFIWFANPDGSYTEENKFESFKAEDGRPAHKNWESDIYDRLRLISTDGIAFTVHKFFKDWPEFAEKTEIKYKVGREGFWSDERTITFRNRDEVIANGFNFLHVTDQQAFNPEEMETWRVCAEYINSDRDNYDYDWVMNTGDQTQNGNRIGEWVDYFRCGEPVLQHKEQMFVVGNNDLSPADPEELGTGSDLSKINSFNITLFYAFEHPHSIPRSTNGTYIPNVYSFIYGDTYFLAMNSEISSLTAQHVFKEPEGSNIYLDIIKPWVEDDLNRYGKDPKIKWRASFNHEAPFTIITAELLMSYAKKNSSGEWEKNMSVERGGSRTNTVGNYWFSEFMEENDFQLCLCGHKHTYSESRYIKNDKSKTMEPIVYDPEYDPNTNTYPDWYNALPEREKNCVQLSNDPTLGFVKYSMSQATGYKLTSNKEMPAQNIPWLKNYYPVTSQIENPSNNTATVTVNTAQRFPHYVIWNVGKGKETENPGVELSNSRDRMLGIPFKVVKKATPTVPWSYKYNTPVYLEDVRKAEGNGSINAEQYILVEKLI